MCKTYISVDIECSGLYPIKGRDKIYCVAASNGKKIDLYENIEQLRPVLEDKTITKIIHHAGFDAFWLKQIHDIEVQNIWDTRLMEMLIIGENLPRNNKDEALKETHSASLLYTLNRYGLADLGKNKSAMGASFATRDRDKPLTKAEIKYAKNDVCYLHQLQRLQEKKLVELDLMRVAKLENKLVEVVVDMRSRGIGFDPDIWEAIAMQNEHDYNKLKSQLPKAVNNWGSSKQVCAYFQSLGVPLYSLTDAEEIYAQFPNIILAQFIKMRALYKSVTTYGNSWLEDLFKGGNNIDPDGRVRADYEQMVNTGRFACSHPNMQQIPREGLHRSAFVPRKGYAFLIPDYDSQEIGIAAAWAKEQRWIDAILRHDDVHSLTAATAFSEQWKNGTLLDCTYPKKCACPTHIDLRQTAKTTNFTILYGGGAKNISLKAHIPESEARRIVYKVKKSTPSLTRCLARAANNAVATRTSYSADPYLRRRTMRDPEDWMLANVGKNNPIQSCGANMLKRAMINLDRKLCPLVHCEHDALMVEVKKSDIAKASAHIKQVMEEAADYCTGIPGLIKANPKVKTSFLK